MIGIFSDWSTYTLRGDISLHDFQCDTGLAIGLGVYTHTDMTWDDGATFKISNFVAGSELGDVDTESLSTPYNPAQSKPVHIVWDYLQTDFDKMFYSTMTNRFVFSQ